MDTQRWRRTPLPRRLCQRQRSKSSPAGSIPARTICRRGGRCPVRLNGAKATVTARERTGEANAGQDSYKGVTAGRDRQFSDNCSRRARFPRRGGMPMRLGLGGVSRGNDGLRCVAADNPRGSGDGGCETLQPAFGSIPGHALGRLIYTLTQRGTKWQRPNLAFTTTSSSVNT